MRIISISLAQTLSPEVGRTLRALKTLPDSWLLWQPLVSGEAGSPDFLLLTPQRQAVLIKVSSAPEDAFPPPGQLPLFGEDWTTAGQAETSALCTFWEEIQAQVAQHLPVALAVIFPNVLGARLPERGASGECPPVVWLGKETLQAVGGALATVLRSTPPLDPPAIDRLRGAFCPDAVIPPALLSQPAPGFLLDYEQEAACKAGLSRGSGAAVAEDAPRVDIVQGASGAGKTLVLLCRMKLFQSRFPERRILALAQDRQRVQEMQARYEALHEQPAAKVTWNTFAGWSRSIWPAGGDWVEPLSMRQRRKLVHEIWADYLPGTSISAGSLLREIDWYKDQGMASREVYLDADRRGRGVRMPAEHRLLVARAIARYQETLRQHGWLDWGDVTLRLLAWGREGGAVLPVYDAIFVDDAQFYSAAGFELLRRVLRPNDGQLFLGAHPAQGFLARGATWKSMGFRVRGHIHRLQNDHRAASEVLRPAALLFRPTLPGQGDGADPFQWDELPAGVLPEMLLLANPQEEIPRMVEEVVSFVEGGFPGQGILVMHTSSAGARLLAQALRQRLGDQAVCGPQSEARADAVRVTDLYGCRGAGRPIVFLAGLRQLYEEEQSARISDEERERFVALNTRWLKRALARAGQRLVFPHCIGLFASGQAPI